MKLTHRPMRWSVYVYPEASPTLGHTVYLGRYRTVAVLIALAYWPFTTRSVQVLRRS